MIFLLVFVAFILVLVLLALVLHFYNREKQQQIGLRRVNERIEEHVKWHVDNCPTACNLLNVGVNIQCPKQSSYPNKNNIPKHNIRLTQLAIYHLLVDRFCGKNLDSSKNTIDFLGGDIDGVIDKILYIKSMGFNTILLSPIYETDAYHGYHITNYEEIEPKFGSWKTFEKLICIAHSKGLRVFCDFVPNHCHKKNSLFCDSKHNDWFYINSDNDYKCFMGHKELPKFNLENKDACDYMIKQAERLVKLGVDGIRIDHAIGVPVTFLSEFNKSVKRINPNFYVFGEILPVDKQYIDDIDTVCSDRKKQMAANNCSKEALQLDYIGMMDGVLDYQYRDILLKEIQLGHRLIGNVGLMSELKAHFNRYPSNFNPIVFLDNHDTDRFLFSCNGNRSLLDEAVTFTKSLGVPYIIYYGTECYMSNKNSIQGSDQPHADLNVREPMKWA